MIRFGYRECTGCHLSAGGGGLLTDYGKGIAAAQAFIAREYEPPTGNLYRWITLDGHLQLGLQSRLLIQRARSDTMVFPMQLDFLQSLRMSDEIHLDISFGVNPRPSNIQKNLQTLFDHWILRKAILRLLPSDALEISAGRDLLPIGLHLEDHTLWIRQRNRRSMNDFFSLLKVHYSTPDYSLTSFVSAPSFQEKTINREVGGGIRGEIALDESAAVGASLYLGFSESLYRQELNIFGRWGNPWMGAIFEYAYTHRDLNQSGTSFSQNAVYARAFYAPWEWLDIGPVAEGLWVDPPFDETAYRVGPQANFRFLRFLRFLSDLRFEHRQSKWEWAFLWQMIGNF